MTTTADSRSVPRTRTPIRIDVWTDLGCPWCYVGTHRLTQAISAVGIDAEVAPHSFELHPEWPAGTSEPVLDIATRVHGVLPQQARMMEEGMARRANGEGLPFVIDRSVGNTFDIHRLLHLAADRGLGAAFFDALQRGYFAGRINPFDPEQLVAAAARAGLAEADVRRVLSSAEYADAVRADQAQARALGITGVPFAVVGGRHAVAGAQSVEVYADVLARAAADTAA